ncbi:hypothetical protein [Paraglaciecola aestuariivivens]
MNLKLILLGAFLAFPMPHGLAQVDKVIEIVKAKSINKTLAKQFPQEKSFQGYSATFSEPKILIDVLDQSIKLALTASSTDQQQSLVVNLIFTGDMRFYGFSESYLFENLKLDSFKIAEDSYSDSSQIIKAIKQSLINDFRELVLFDLGPVTQLERARAADQIEISKQQLLLIWHK